MALSKWTRPLTIKLGCKRWCCAIAFLLMELWPILVGLVDVARDVLEPLLLDILVVIQIELAVDDLPSFRIHRYSVTLAHAERAITAVLRCVPRGIFRESVAMSRRCKQPLRPVPGVHIFRRAFHSLGLLEISNRIVAFYGDSFRRRVHQRDFLLLGKSGRSHNGS